MNEVKKEEDMERIVIFQVNTPNENMVMCLREDYKMEIGVSVKEVKQ